MKTNWTRNTTIKTRVVENGDYLNPITIVVDCKADYKITSARTYKNGTTKYYVVETNYYEHPQQGNTVQKDKMGYLTLEQLAQYYGY